MLKEEKKVELIDGDLDKVNGGYIKRIDNTYDFIKGDCFSNETNIFKVLYNYLRIDEDAYVECTKFSKRSWLKCHDKVILRENEKVKESKLNKMTYEGTNYI